MLHDAGGCNNLIAQKI